MQKRLEYIDTAKGLLIIFVVAGHISMSFDGRFGDDPFVRGMHWFFQNCVNTYFMPAFFVITGFCSNFGKRFRDYMLSAVISLKMPVFFFIGVMGALCIRPLFGFSPFSPYWWGIRLFESGLWFLHAMFLVKIAYWFVNRWGNTTTQTVIVLLLYSIGACCVMQGIPSRFWVLHALMLMPFIHLGRCMKSVGFTKRIGAASLGAFACVSAAILVGGGVKRPASRKQSPVGKFGILSQFWLLPPQALSPSFGFANTSSIHAYFLSSENTRS